MSGSKRRDGGASPDSEAEQLRALIREAHEMLRDLRREIANARVATEGVDTAAKLAASLIREAVGAPVSKWVDDAVRREVTLAGEAIRRNMAEIDALTVRRYKELVERMETNIANRYGTDSIEQLTDIVRATLTDGEAAARRVWGGPPPPT